MAFIEENSIKIEQKIQVKITKLNFLLKDLMAYFKNRANKL